MRTSGCSVGKFNVLGFLALLSPVAGNGIVPGNLTTGAGGSLSQGFKHKHLLEMSSDAIKNILKDLIS